MTAALEILAALVFAKYGGGLLVCYDDEPEKRIGWAFLLAGVGLAVRAGVNL